MGKVKVWMNTESYLGPSWIIMNVTFYYFLVKGISIIIIIIIKIQLIVHDILF